MLTGDEWKSRPHPGLNKCISFNTIGKDYQVISLVWGMSVLADDDDDVVVVHGENPTFPKLKMMLVQQAPCWT